MDQYVYKAGQCSIITLEITGKTNEKRGGIADPLHAKFRTDKALVIDIKNFTTGLQMEEDVSKHDPEFVYKVGEEVRGDDYDEDINEVCAPGIHYFKTKEAAESWWLRHNLYKIEGLYRTWYENGQLESEANYKDGKKDGLYRWWHCDSSGKLKEESNYKDGKWNGSCKWWHENGALEIESNYKDGRKDGLYRWWTDNIQLQVEDNYKDGERYGLQKWRDKNGELKEEYV
jgi:antitoxin component YwqK of YwqJK toxin-antitoxin module